jgi:hypothetical protein
MEPKIEIGGTLVQRGWLAGRRDEVVMTRWIRRAIIRPAFARDPPQRPPRAARR